MSARRVLRALLASALIFNVILVLGDWTPVPSLWAWAALAAAMPLVSVLLVGGETLRERWKNKGRSIDPIRLRVVQAGQLAMNVVGPLDVGRLHWTDTVPVWSRFAALAVAAGGFAMVVWSMRANRFFLPAIRIQEERGHQLVTGGPYRFLRHPGYAGIILLDGCCGLAVGSWLGFLVGLVPACLFAARTADEDRFLHEHLAGYREFAGRVRYRLVPRLW